MNSTVKAIIDKATYRAKNEGMFVWEQIGVETRIQQIQLFLGIIITEMEMSQYASDLDKEAISIVRKMTISEWKSLEFIYEQLPDTTDSFIKKKIEERVNAGYEKHIDSTTGEMIVTISKKL